MRPAVLLPTLALLLSAAPALAAPAVVATTKPVHSLVSAVMGDLGTPSLIVRGAASPHSYSLRPSDARAIEQADLVFWTGHGMELFLGDTLDSLGDGATVVELAETPGIELLPTREGGAFDAHEHEEEHEEHHHPADGHDHAEGELDMHFWLDPANARLMVAHIAEALAAADPDNAVAYRGNAEAAAADLTALEAELATTLAPVRDKPFIVFHDAYQYFERRFDLSVAGSVTVTPDTMPGAARVQELKQKIATSGAACVFAEPQFEPAIIAAIVEGSGARAGELDPEGAGLTEGPGLYRELLTGLAGAIKACLAG